MVILIFFVVYKVEIFWVSIMVIIRIVNVLLIVFFMVNGVFINICNIFVKVKFGKMICILIFFLFLVILKNYLKEEMKYYLYFLCIFLRYVYLCILCFVVDDIYNYMSI